MKLNVPTVGDVSIDFRYVRIEQQTLLGTVITEHDGTHYLKKTVGWKLKTICTMTIGEIEIQDHVWKASRHEHGFNLNEERKRALTQALMFGFSPLVHDRAGNKEKRRAIWAALHAAGFHPFPVSKVDRLTKLLEKAKKRAGKRK